MHTNSTPNYNLPQFVSADKPTWLGDFNGAMLAIDTAIAGVNTVAASADAKADLATTAAQTASGVATDAASAAASASADAASAITTAGNAATAAQSASTAAQSAQSTADSAASAAATAQSTASGAATAASAAATAASAVDTKVGNLADLDTTDKSSIVNAINEVAAGSGGGSASITGDGVKTFNTLFAELFQLVDIAKVTEKTALIVTSTDGSKVVYIISRYDNATLRFSTCNAGANSASIVYFGVGAAAFGYRADITTGAAITDVGASVAPSGTIISVKY